MGGLDLSSEHPFYSRLHPINIQETNVIKYLKSIEFVNYSIYMYIIYIIKSNGFYAGDIPPK